VAGFAVIQAASYVFPLLTAAYTARVLGAEAWGHVVIVQAVLAYFGVFAGWGFGWSATRKLAAAQGDPGEVTAIVTATATAQLMMTLSAVAALLFCMAVIPHFREGTTYYAWGALGLAASALSPSWLFTGLERMRDAAAMQVVSRALALGLVLLTVHSPSDAPLTIACGAAGALVSGAWTVWWARHRIELRFDWRGIAKGWQEIRESAPLFVSLAAVSLYSNAAPLVLGAVAGSAAAGHFVLADRIRLAAQTVLAPVSNAIFPRMSRLVAQDPARAGSLLIRTGGPLVAVSTLISVALFALAEPLVATIGGEAFAPSVEILHWLAILPALVSISNVLGFQVMLPNQRNTAVTAIIAGASLLSLALILPSVRANGTIGAALVLCIAESVVAVSMLLYVMRTGLLREMLRRPANAPSL
jgi:PST family polysaccharide transporter